MHLRSGNTYSTHKKEKKSKKEKKKMAFYKKNKDIILKTIFEIINEYNEEKSSLMKSQGIIPPQFKHDFNLRLKTIIKIIPKKFRVPMTNNCNTYIDIAKLYVGVNKNSFT